MAPRDPSTTTSDQPVILDTEEEENQQLEKLISKDNEMEDKKPPGRPDVHFPSWGLECLRGATLILPFLLALEYFGCFQAPYYWITCFFVGLLLNEISCLSFQVAQYILPFSMATYLLVHGQVPTLQTLIWFLPINYFYVGVPMSVILHRYFAHNSYETSRIFQFVLGFVSCCAYQGGPLWWAAKHGKHHCHCDQPEDPHSAKQTGVFYSWVLWTMDPKHHQNRDLEYLNPKFLTPELKFVDRFYLLPPVIVLTISELYFGRLNTVTLVYLPMITCRLATLWFNVDFHPVDLPKRCTAIDKFILSHELVGESLHEDHHRVPNRARRKDLDIAWWVSLSWMEQIGLVWNCK